MAAVDDPLPDERPPLKKRRSSITEPPSMSTEGTPLRMIAFGSSGHHQFALTESILQGEIFNKDHPHTILTTKTSGSPFGRHVTLVNTPNLLNHDLLHYMLKKELKKAVCFSCPGPHAILLTLNPSDVPPNVYDIFKPVVQYFGESILNNTVIVLYHEEEKCEQTLDDMEKNKQFKELLKKCSRRHLIFSAKGNEPRTLFEEVDKMVAAHGIFSNLEFKDAEKRIGTEEKIIEKQRTKEINAMLKELAKKHSQEDLEREMSHYNERIRLENRERAEVQIADRLGFTLRLVDYAAAIGKGAFAGAILAAALGFPGMAVGAVVGAAFGGLISGAFGAAWNILSNALADFGGDAT